jgi:hypothetical protein
VIYWYTGQPGHGKTLHGIQHAMQFKDEGRHVFVCNVRGFDHDRAGMSKMTPEDFCNWMDFLPDGAVALVDEAYEHGMLPKRSAASKLPAHVERLATHRHRGIDFIFICQSPEKQCDQFVHDLIDQHIHVRRRFGTKFVHLRTFDRFERNPAKAHPITIKRVALPKRPMGMYQSTEMDTTERSIPWYYIALWVGLPAMLALIFFIPFYFKNRFMPDEGADSLTAIHSVAEPRVADGAAATAEQRGDAVSKSRDYTKLFVPEVPGQPWTAPAYDGVAFAQRPPRVFCMSSGWDGSDSCTCLTDQGTAHMVDLDRCRIIARRGQFDPFYDVRDAEANRLTDVEQQSRIRQDELGRRSVSVPGSSFGHSVAEASSSSLKFGEMAVYGAHALAPPAPVNSEGL